MPMIPDFQNNMMAQPAPGPPRQDIAVAEAPGAALQQAGGAVTAEMDAFQKQYAEARRQTEASTAIAQGMNHADALQHELGKLPDRHAAMAQFSDRFGQARASILDGITDPLVRSHVEGQLQTYGASRLATTGQAALHTEASAANAAQDSQFSRWAQTLANESNPLLRAQIMDAMDASARGSAAAGYRTHEQAFQLTSRAYRSSVQMVAAADPIAAAAWLKQINEGTPRMTAEDIAGMEYHLRNEVPRQIGENNAANQPLWNGTAQVSGDTKTRAQAVISGLVARGMDQETATAMAARSVLESGANHAGPAGDGGISHGLLQWNKDRLANFQRMFGHSPEQGTLDEALDFIVAELKGPEAAAGQAIANAQGLDAKARAVSELYVRPANRAAEASRTAAVARNLAGQPVDDVSAQLSDLRRANDAAGLTPSQQLHSEGMFLRRYHDTLSAQAQQRGDLERTLTNLEAGYQQGLVKPEIPADDIRRLIPGQKGEQMIQHLTLTRQAGEIYNGIQFASPAEEQAAVAALSIPGALSSGQIRLERGKVIPPPGGVVSPGEETPDAMKQRLHLQQLALAQVAKKHEALLKDPAVFAAQDPTLAARLQSVDPKDPASVQGAITASLALQQHLGVPEGQTRVMSNAQVAATVAQLHGTDPAKGDMGAALDQVAKQYGPHWPAALGELVKVGKISGDYQLLAAATAPAQAGARQDFQRALMFRTQKGGWEQMRKEAPPNQMKKIDNDIDSTLDDFRATVGGSQGGLALLATMRDGVRTLATYYAIRGDSGSTALEKAYNGLFGDRFDAMGGWLAPKGQMNAVRLSADSVQKGLTLADIAPLPERYFPGETEANRRAALLKGAQRGRWIPNDDSSGLVLEAKLIQGQTAPVMRPDGTRVEIKFDALPTGKYNIRAGTSALRLQGYDPRGVNVPVDGPVAGPPGSWANAPPSTDHPGFNEQSAITNRPVGSTISDQMRPRGSR